MTCETAMLGGDTAGGLAISRKSQWKDGGQHVGRDSRGPVWCRSPLPMPGRRPRPAEASQSSLLGDFGLSPRLSRSDPVTDRGHEPCTGSTCARVCRAALGATPSLPARSQNSTCKFTCVWLCAQFCHWWDRLGDPLLVQGWSAGLGAWLRGRTSGRSTQELCRAVLDTVPLSCSPPQVL